MNGNWTKTEIEILECLTLKVRTLTAEQLALGWWGTVEQVDEAQQYLQPLCQVGLVERIQVYAHPIIPISPPAFHWSPGDAEPTDEHLRQLSSHFRERWTQPEQTFIVYVATRRAANLFGSHALDPPSTEQWTHDIHVSEIYVDMKQRNSAEKMRYVVGEGALPKLGTEIKFMKDPDIFIVDEHQQAEMVIEFAGAYDVGHIKDLHAHCAGEAHRKLKRRFPHRKHRLYPNPKGTPYILV